MLAVTADIVGCELVDELKITLVSTVVGELTQW